GSWPSLGDFPPSTSPGATEGRISVPDGRDYTAAGAVLTPRVDGSARGGVGSIGGRIRVVLIVGKLLRVQSCEQLRHPPPVKFLGGLRRIGVFAQVDHRRSSDPHYASSWWVQFHRILTRH